MKYAKDLAIILTVVFLAAACFIVLEGTLEKATAHESGKYNYGLSLRTSFAASDGSTVHAPDGCTYIVADVVLLNIDWHTGISDDASYFRLIVNGEEMPVSPDTSLYTAHSSAALYKPGERGENSYLYLAPAGKDVSDAHILYTRSDKVVYDPLLELGISP